jgi:hypothetical protein
MVDFINQISCHFLKKLELKYNEGKNSLTGILIGPAFSFQKFIPGLPS